MKPLNKECKQQIWQVVNHPELAINPQMKEWLYDRLERSILAKEIE